MPAWDLSQHVHTMNNNISLRICSLLNLKLPPEETLSPWLPRMPMEDSSDYIDVQADQCLWWVHMLTCSFCRTQTHLSLKSENCAQTNMSIQINPYQAKPQYMILFWKLFNSLDPDLLASQMPADQDIHCFTSDFKYMQKGNQPFLHVTHPLDQLYISIKIPPRLLKL